MLSQTRPGLKPGREAELLSVLNKFYYEAAEPTENPELGPLRAMVDRVVARVEAIDPRFRCQVWDVGSLASGVSAVVACEFDILLCLDIEGTDEESVLSPGYAKFKLTDKSAAMWADARTGKYLHPRKITDMFQGYVRKAVKHMEGNTTKKYNIGGQGSVATTIATTSAQGLKYKADLVLAVTCRGWPSSANAECLQPGYTGTWPRKDTIRKIKANGYDMVAKYVNEYTPGIGDKGADLELLWRLSVSRAETLLLKTIDDGGTNLCHKKVLIIFKALRLNYLVTSSTKVPQAEMTIPLSSYFLKTMLFHESQLYPNPRQWTEGKLAERFMSMLYSLHWKVNIVDLSPFLIPGINMCSKRSIMATGMWKVFMTRLVQNPIAYISSVMPIDESTKYLYTIYTSV